MTSTELTECEGCEGTGKIMIFPDSPEVHPCPDCQPEDFADWQGRPTEEEEAAMWADHARYERAKRWRALASLFRPKEWADGTSWRDIPKMIACAIALILGREYSDRLSDRYPYYHYECMTNWGYNRTYAGWDIQCLDFHFRAFRYHIYEDGDWNL